MKVNLLNGILDLDTKTMERHHPKHLYTQQINARFVSKQERADNLKKQGCELPTPYIDRVREAYPNSFKQFEQYVQSIIYYDLRIEMMLYLIGPTGSGKGTVLGLIQELFKECSVIGVLHDLHDDMGLIVNQRVFFDTDMAIMSLGSKCVAMIKKITGKDTVQGIKINIKYVKKFQDKIRCFIVCATNQFPRLPAKTDRLAWFRRVLILPFNTIQKSDMEFKENILHDIDNWFTQLVLSEYNPIVTKDFDKRAWAYKQAEIWDYSANPFRRYVKEMFVRTTDIMEIQQDKVCDYIRDRMNDDEYDIPRETELKQNITSEISAIRIRKMRKKNIQYYYPCKLRDEWVEYGRGKMTLEETMAKYGPLIKKYRTAKVKRTPISDYHPEVNDTKAANPLGSWVARCKAVLKHVGKVESFKVEDLFILMNKPNWGTNITETTMKMGEGRFWTLKEQTYIIIKQGQMIL